MVCCVISATAEVYTRRCAMKPAGVSRERGEERGGDVYMRGRGAGRRRERRGDVYMICCVISATAEEEEYSRCCAMKSTVVSRERGREREEKREGKR